MDWRARVLAGLMAASLLGCRKEDGAAPSGAPATSNGLPGAMAMPSIRTNVSVRGTNEPTNEQLEALMHARRFPEAWEVATALLKLKPEDEDVRFNAGFVASELGKTNEAILHYQECVRLVPEYAEAHNNLGNLFRKAGQPEVAIRHFEEAIQHAPSNASAHNNLGTTLAMAGRVDEAVPHFVHATQIRADYTEAWLNLGNAYMQQDRIQEATVPLQKALELSPQHPAVNRAIARLRQKLR
jgi:tetratricopeptide (TPR) repeat protein